MSYQYRGTLTIEAEPISRLLFDGDKCGTYSGYKQHQNHGVPPCKPCKRANSEHVKAWYARKKEQAL